MRGRLCGARANAFTLTEEGNLQHRLTFDTSARRLLRGLSLCPRARFPPSEIVRLSSSFPQSQSSAPTPRRSVLTLEPLQRELSSPSRARYRRFAGRHTIPSRLRLAISLDNLGYDCTSTRSWRRQRRAACSARGTRFAAGRARRCRDERQSSTATDTQRRRRAAQSRRCTASPCAALTSLEATQSELER